MDMTRQIMNATARVRAGGNLPERLAGAFAALRVAHLATRELEDAGDPRLIPKYTLADQAVNEAEHSVRRAPSLPWPPDTVAGDPPSPPRPPDTTPEMGLEAARAAHGPDDQIAAALADLADALDREMTTTATRATDIDDRMACLGVALNAARLHDTLASSAKVFANSRQPPPRSQPERRPAENATQDPRPRGPHADTQADGDLR